MRNGAAHKLHVEFSADDRKVFWAALPQFLRDNLLLEFKSSEGQADRLTLGQMFYGLVLYADIVRQKNNTQRVEVSYGRKYLERVLGKK
jgi:hypothetical protein